MVKVINIAIKITPDEISDREDIEYPVGVTAEAQVGYKMPQGGYRLDYLESSGLWGLDGNDDDYIKDVAQEELDDLKEHLKEFGVNISGFNSAAKIALDKL